MHPPSVSRRSAIYSSPSGFVWMPSASSFLFTVCVLANLPAASLHRSSISVTQRNQHSRVGGDTRTDSCRPLAAPEQLISQAAQGVSVKSSCAHEPSRFRACKAGSTSATPPAILCIIHTVPATAHRKRPHRRTGTARADCGGLNRRASRGSDRRGRRGWRTSRSAEHFATCCTLYGGSRTRSKLRLRACSCPVVVSTPV
jgi:hypothetical protein